MRYFQLLGTGRTPRWVQNTNALVARWNECVGWFFGRRTVMGPPMAFGELTEDQLADKGIVGEYREE